MKLEISMKISLQQIKIFAKKICENKRTIEKKWIKSQHDAKYEFFNSCIKKD